ncbi:cache domain-containing protein [Gimesia alba]|uniref:cache domain-containing protein n=1 Tax=Gimesia alba TaxID=2527973 RepID=UPI0018D7235D|nr:ATP-binding protein [Gimesia alba]
MSNQEQESAQQQNQSSRSGRDLKKGTTQQKVLQPVRLYHNLKVRILLPVVIAMVVILGCGLFGMYWQDRQAIDSDVHARVKGAQQVLANQLDEDASLLIGFQQFLADNEKLQEAWFSKDREELLRQATPIYEKINKSNRVTHFYFIDLEHTCFLRVHRPSQFGDTIRRKTMKQAATTGKTTYGIELGKFGHFTLRVVKPWFVNGKHVGYIELGEEIEHITPKLSETLGVQVVFAIEKRCLDQKQWEQGLKILGHAGNWDQLSNFVIIDKTIGSVPQKLLSQIDSGKTENTQISLTDSSTGKMYHGGIMPLMDAGDQQVGSLVIMKDITQQTAELRRMASLLLIVGFVVGGVLFAVCYIYISSLRNVSKQLIETAHQAGKAEIATSVLHNVGNVLNSVNVSAGLIQDNVLKSSAHNLTKAIDVMQQHLDDIGDFVTNDDRGKHLPRFLIDVSQQISSEEESILEEVHSLIRNIDHIKAVVASQQKNANGTAGVLEEFSLVELLEDAININTASMERHSVKIVRKFDDIEPVVSDKQLLLQIIVNLISNAKYACMESGNKKHLLTVRLKHKAQDRVVIEVQDNGMGITAENLTKIFSHGFTTRKEGHGFGLHSAILAARELGGSLTASSDGPGTGATFTLEIPYQKAGTMLCTK